MKYLYPSVFERETNGNYTVTVPDVRGCITFGKTTDEAFFMIKDALAACLCVLEDNFATINPPTEPNKLTPPADGFITLVDVDTLAYRAQTDKKSVRANVSLPAWLKFAAERADINFSQLLQQAIKAELNL